MERNGSTYSESKTWADRSHERRVNPIGINFFTYTERGSQGKPSEIACGESDEGRIVKYNLDKGSGRRRRG